MAVIGYARVSTDHQSLEAQHDALTAAGCERIFTDKLSGARDDRPGLAALLDYVRAGDTVTVVALDRLGRSLSAVIRTIERLTEDQVLLRSLREGIDYSTSTGRMLAGIFAALAEYERELIHKRAAAAARAAARLRGRHTGRPPRLTPTQTHQVQSLRTGGNPSPHWSAPSGCPAPRSTGHCTRPSRPRRHHRSERGVCLRLAACRHMQWTTGLPTSDPSMPTWRGRCTPAPQHPVPSPVPWPASSSAPCSGS
jgi:DNA invertase Pin-like site-specific DNA recombinase